MDKNKNYLVDAKKLSSRHPEPRQRRGEGSQKILRHPAKGGVPQNDDKERNGFFSDNYLTLKKICLQEGMDLFGVADIRDIKNEFQISPKALANLDKAICLGLRLSQAILSEMEQKPTKLYFHHYKIVNSFLDYAALKLGNIIQRQGYAALAIPATQIIDWEKNTAHLSHRKLGVLAGLCWIGRNNLLVNEELGSQFRLVSILTDMPLKIDKLSRKDCQDCRLCVKMCPAGAIQESSADFDHHKCFEKLKSFQTQRQVEQFVCGVCVNACRPVRGIKNERKDSDC